MQDKITVKFYDPNTTRVSYKNIEPGRWYLRGTATHVLYRRNAEGVVYRTNLDSLETEAYGSSDNEALFLAVNVEINVKITPTAT